MGLMTGPHARNPRTHSQWIMGPGRTPKRTGSPGWESARPRTPHTQARGAPSERTRAARTARKASLQERALWGGDGSPRPHPPDPQPVGSGPRPHAPKDGRSGVGERPTRDVPHPGKGRLPPGALVPPPQRAKPACKSACFGVVMGPHARAPPHRQPVGRGPGCTPQRKGCRGWESARPRTPHTQTHSPKPGRRENWTGPAPPTQAKRSTGPRQDTQGGTGRVERPYQRPAPEPREVRASHQPGEGGGAQRPRERERTYTQRTRGENQKSNRTEPAERTDRMEWRTSERG